MDNISPGLRDFAESIRQAGIAKKQIHIQGGGTHSFENTGEQLLASSLNAIIKYAPDDMTITVESGMPWIVLQNTLKDHHQWLPVEPPVNEKSTVGGVVAINASGPSRYRYGSLRNWLLGARFVTANGEIAHSGSKVVKSVAGYDVHKLLIGSHGTLAAIADLTFKVAPLPERRIVAVVQGESIAALLPNIISRLHEILPAYAIYCTKPFGMQSSLTINNEGLIVGFDGFTEDVESQVNKLREMFSRMDIKVLVNEPDFSELCGVISSFTLGKPNAMRIATMPSEIGMLANMLEKFPALIDLANGTVDIVPDEAQFSSLLSVIASKGTHGVYLWRNEKAAKIGGVSEAEKKLAHRLKETFDPHGVFNQRGYYS